MALNDSHRKLLDAFSKNLDQLIEEHDILEFDEGVEIVSRNTTPAKCGLVVEGFVKGIADIKLVTRRPKRTVDFYGEKDWFGAEIVHTNLNMKAYHAAGYARVILFDGLDFLKTTTNEVLLNIHMQYSFTLEFHEFLQHMCNETIEVRILNTLAYLRMRFEKHYEIPITVQEFSDFVGTSRARVTKYFKELEDESLVERGYKYIGIAEIEKLFAKLEQFIHPETA